VGEFKNGKNQKIMRSLKVLVLMSQGNLKVLRKAKVLKVKMVIEMSVMLLLIPAKMVKVEKMVQKLLQKMKMVEKVKKQIKLQILVELVVLVK